MGGKESDIGGKFLCFVFVLAIVLIIALIFKIPFR